MNKTSVREKHCLNGTVGLRKLNSAVQVVQSSIEGTETELCHSAIAERLSIGAIQMNRAVEVANGEKLNIVEEARRAGDPPELVAVADRVREVLGWTPKLDDLDTIVRTSLEWERKIAARDPSAYWAT